MPSLRVRLRQVARASQETPAASFSSGAISRKSSRSLPAGCLAGFFALFFFFGLGFFGFFLAPAMQVLKARSWTAARCTVLASEVESHSGSDSATYSVAVRYRYQVDGVAYESDRYEFLGGSSSGYEHKQDIVERYPPGSRPICWVDPADPTQAVLERGLTRGYLFALIPGVFMLVGGGGAALALLAGRRRQPDKAMPWLPEARGEPVVPGLTAGGGSTTAAGFADAEAGPTGPMVLHARAGPVGKLVGITLIAAFWNGITGVFVWKAFEGWRGGAGDGCLTVFILPFVVIGLALLLGVPYQFLALFNPRLHLTLSSASLPLGGSARLSWSFSGFPGRIRRLRIELEGREEATYQRGTSTQTDRQVFATVTVVDTSERLEIPAGEAAVSVPADTMHSFAADHNRIVWSLKVSGDIRRWPDVSEEFELVVRPREIGP
jgi:Protein of unknown function (DUF3592)